MLNELEGPGKSVHTAILGGGTTLNQIPDITDGEPFAQEWQAFKREVYRLLEEGHQGKFAAFKGDQLIGVWNSLPEAVWNSYEQAGNEECLVQQIQLYDRPIRWGYRR